MDIVSILLGFFGGAVIGGGVLFGVQKGKLGELEQRYTQARQAYDSAEAELKEKNSQLQLLDLSEVRIRELEAKYKEQLEQLEQSHHTQQQQLEEELEKSQNHLEMMESTYQAQILSLQTATHSTEALEQSYQENIQDYEDRLTDLQQTHQNELEEIQQSHLRELEQLQETHQAQLQDVEQFYQARIEEIEGVYQTQIQELQQTKAFQEDVQPQSFVEPWDEMAVAVDEAEVAEISSLEELAVPLEVADEPRLSAMNFIDTPTVDTFEDFSTPSEENMTVAPPSPSEDAVVSPVSKFEEFTVVTQETFILETDSPELDFLESLQPETDDVFSVVDLEDLEMGSEDVSVEMFMSESEEIAPVTDDAELSPEMDFLATLHSEEETLSFSNLEDLTVSEEFFNTDSTSENSFLDLMPTADEIALEEVQAVDLTLSAEDLFVSEGISSEEELFDPFEAKIMVNEQYYYSNNMDSSSDDDDELDFLNMLEEEEPEGFQSSEDEDLDNVAFDELFSEDLLNANWEATKKHHPVDTLDS